MGESPTDLWREFRVRFQHANERLVSVMAATEGDVRSLIDRSRDQLISITPNQLKPGKTASFEDLFGEMENRLFSGPVGSFEAIRPLARTLSAIEQHRLEMNDLARRLPLVITVSGAELLEILGPDVRGRWRKAWVRRLRSPRPLRLREIVLGQVCGQLAERLRFDRDFQRGLAQAGLHLLAAWQIFRRHQLTILAGGDRDKTTLAKEQKWWSRTSTSLQRRTERLARSYRHWAELSPVLLSEAVLRRSREFSDRRQRKILDGWQDNISRWHRQRRAVRALINLERQLTSVSREAIQATRQALESLRVEHDDVTGEMTQAIAWFRAGLEQSTPEVFPSPKANLLSAEQRARDWSERLSSSIQASVPASIEAVRLQWAIPAWRKPWRQLHPKSVLLNALEHAGLDATREGFREGEAEHTAVIRDIEQARQVLTFGLEAGQSEGGTVKKLPREAAANALALLEHRQEILIDAQPAAEAGLCRAQALTLLQTHTSLDIGRLGLLALFMRQGAPRAARHLGKVALGSIRAATRVFRTAAGQAFQWTAWKLGWEMPAAPTLEPLTERARLSTILAVRPRSQELPALYQRLFSLAPVKDQRFLVARETEMNGLVQALSLWQSGHSVTVLVVGARGSGKTSLLSCAAGAVFTGVPVVQGQFCRRIRSQEQMSEFLRDLFQISPGADLATVLNQGRRVVVIEEFERTFLRCMNGFDAQREFLRLMAATSGSTLWILSMNQASFSYLDAVVGLGRNFSHCVNAMSVSPEHMIDAILQRHTLSGLRLQFAPRPPGDPRINRLRRFFALEQNSQQLFFNALYRQSEGLFRSALELWLGSIGRIEGAVVHMLQPLDPNYSRLEAELKPDDLFTLQAILQHASLTAEELAEVFSIGIEEARGRLERLQALEILESEPACPGLRVCPQAGRFVRDALARQNLL